MLELVCYIINFKVWEKRIVEYFINVLFIIIFVLSMGCLNLVDE